MLIGLDSALRPQFADINGIAVDSPTALREDSPMLTFILCAVTSLPFQDVSASLSAHFAEELASKPIPFDFSPSHYDPVSVELGAVTTIGGGYVENELYMQFPVLVSVHVSAPEPLFNKHVSCTLGFESWTCRESTVWQGEFSADTWHDFDVPLARLAEELLQQS